MAQIDKAAALTQLSRICKSKEFGNKPLMSKFVSYLVNEYLEGRGEQLKGYTIAVELFEQGVEAHNAGVEFRIDSQILIELPLKAAAGIMGYGREAFYALSTFALVDIPQQAG